MAPPKKKIDVNKISENKMSPLLMESSVVITILEVILPSSITLPWQDFDKQKKYL